MKLYALIMAGGEGKRFWPLSTSDKPKQFLPLLSDKSLLRQTVDRILPIIPIERVFIITVGEYEEETLRHIPELPPENLLIEPEGKNTAPCIAYGSLKISGLDPDSVTAVLPADHAIGNEDEYRKVLAFAYEAANSELKEVAAPLITLGVKSVSPDTGYGYIKAGEQEVLSSTRYKALKALKFTEKPDADTALRFLNEGYFWNSGIFIWKTSSILTEYCSMFPQWRPSFDEISGSLGSSREARSVADFYAQIEGGSVDKLILERSENTLVIPVDFPWSDVGSWKALDQYLRKDSTENLIRGSAVSVDSSSCMVLGEGRTVALVGVRDVVVVDTKDAVLVLNKESSQDVKKVLEELDRLGKSD
jgi:mannose-1-phosphate guanylyltransferase